MTATISKTDILSMGATDMASAIAAGELTPTEIAEVLLERIAAYDGAVKSFSNIDVEAIRREAAVLTAEAKAGTLRGPLHGVPFGVKEQFAVAGRPTLGDWSDPSPATAATDATVVAKLKAAGALLFGKLYMVGPAGTPPTRNPWSLDCTPGGSSSGSGAAVGARFVPFALSEQTAGSGIRPAAYCGVSGMKPTYGRNSRFGMFQMVWSTDHACIIGTSVKDVARVFSVTSGYDPKDPTTLPGGPAELEPALTRPPRIGVVRNFFPEMTEPEMQRAIEASAQTLAAAGAEVVDFSLPEAFELTWPLYMLVSAPEGAIINLFEAERRAAKGLPGRSGVPVTTSTRFAMLPAALREFVPATYYLQAQRLRRWLRDQVDASMAGYDAILMATAPGPAPRDPSTSGDPSLLTPWSLLGNPEVNIAAGLSTDGRPMGMQLVGPNMSDEHLLAVGAWCEDVLGRLPIPEIG